MRRFALALVLASAFPTAALAQVSLTGTYVTYLDVGPDGTMIDLPAMHSMAYTETGSPPASCDAFYPGTPQEGFTVQATSASGTMLQATNTNGSGGAFTTTSPTAVAGRDITWSGTYASGTSSFRIDETYELQTADRFVTLTVTLTNTGSGALTDVYYLRNADPDQGSCGAGGYSTNNDVVLQPPTDDSALVTAGAATPGGTLYIGIGAHDTRARGYTGGFTNTDGRTEWTTPMDHNGASADEAIDLIFHEPSVPAGGSTTFVLYYVWGPDVATVQTRFADLGVSPCAGADGSACASTSGAAGTCHAMRCCTGCWDGSTCHSAGTTTACGLGGGACTDCTDTNSCTLDVCGRTTGTCTHPFAAAGASCDDGLYCTATDTCNATGTCTGTGTPCNDGNACTTDTCSEATRSCGHAGLADGTACPSGLCRASACCTGCWDGTACQPGFAAGACGTAGSACASCIDGDQCTNDVCSAGTCSNPLSSTAVPCDDGLYCTRGDHCDGADHCTSGTSSPCDDMSSCTIDVCDEPTHACSHMTATGGCAIFGTCFVAGDVNPSNRCQVCDPTRSTMGWSIATGMACGTATCAGSMITPAPTCDATGACLPSARVPCPSGFCASATMCASACAMDSDCGATGYCDTATGMCAPRFTPGSTCDRDTECAAGVCSADHHCCASACAGTCQSCAVPGNLGRCLPVPAGTDPDMECAAGETCTAAGTCGAGMLDAGAPDSGASDMGTVPVDLGSGTDASVPPSDMSAGVDMGFVHSKAGCCAVAGARGDEGLAALALAFVALALVRRRRRAC